MHFFHLAQDFTCGSSRLLVRIFTSCRGSWIRHLRMTLAPVADASDDEEGKVQVTSTELVPHVGTRSLPCSDPSFANCILSRQDVGRRIRAVGTLQLMGNLKTQVRGAMRVLADEASQFLRRHGTRLAVKRVRGEHVSLGTAAHHHHRQ